MLNSIDSKTQGAWLIHHANKLQTVSTQAFENIGIAGKAGMLLSALSSSEQFVLERSRVDILAKEANINRLEQDSLLNMLEAHQLISISKSGIEILGLTTSATLEHTSKIFENSNPSNSELASILLSEKISEAPYSRNDILLEISDEYWLSSREIDSFQTNIEQQEKKL